MALKVLNPGTVAPIGQFDCVDGVLSSIKGGEVATLTGVTYQGSDVAAADAADGYTGTNSKTRPAVTTSIGTGAGGPYFLTDDGIAHYGTLFGSVVGGSTGQSVAGTALGPHTATASGKVTLWGAPGLYAATLDAVDSATLAPSIAISVGAALTATSAGLLGTGGTGNGGATMARFVEFATDGSLVKTPNSLAGALVPSSFSQVVFYWLGK